MFKRLVGRGNIKQKVIFLVNTQLLIALLCMLFIALFLVERQVNKQTEKLFISNSTDLSRSIEKRLAYLIENTTLLATNDLMINALTDSIGREVYLKPLVLNFIKGKDVRYLNLVDFDGQAIFQTGEKVPKYNQSKQLRTALALNQRSISIDQFNNLTVIIPIEYYNTTQGAVIVSFDLETIILRNIQHDGGVYTQLLKSGNIVFSHNYDPSIDYRSYLHYSTQSLPLLSELEVNLEVGLPYDVYREPTLEAILILTATGFILIILSLIISRLTAIRITKPILELASRVKQAHEGKDVYCSPLGSGDELESLAKAFDERTLLLEHQAEHDSLTELPNRLLFLDRLKQAITLAKRQNETVTTLFIDLDRFKEVNDSYGHSVGDQLIQVIASKLENTIRDSDSVARMGGDEFTVLIGGNSTEENIVAVIQKILDLFKSPICFSCHELFITCSIGVATYPSDGNSAEALLKNADAAMYKAKVDGRNTYRFYKQELTEKIIERVHLEQQMRLAIEGDQFQVYFQPQYDLRSTSIIGMEALIRWKHPEEGILSPIRFIPLAEENGMIVEIDRLMMLSAMQEFSEWKKAGLMPGKLSMNLSMLQLEKDDFIDFVIRCASACELPTSDLIFEVTETQAMLNPERSIIALNALKSLGPDIAIDDFGTGFSSLSYLKRFPVDKIKIDQSFISDIPNDQDDIALTNAIIALSHNLKLSVIAEGVETESQLDFLVQNGCIEGQGYFFSKPIPGEEMRQLLANS